VIDEIADRRKGDRQKDACDTQEPAPYDEGDQDPDCRDSQLPAEQTGLDDIAVQCLQDQREQQEPNCVPGVDQEQDGSADHCACHGAEGRSQVGDSHNDRDDRHVGHPHEEHKEPVTQTDDEAVQKVKGDVLDQNCVAAAPEGRGSLVDSCRHQSLHEPQETALEARVIQHQIDGQNEGNDPVKDPGPETIRGIDELIDIFRQDPGDRLQDFITGGDKLRQIDVMAGGELVELLDQPLKGAHITVQVSGECHDAVDDLRHQCHHEDHKEEDHRQNSTQYREGMAHLVLFDPIKDPVGIQADERMHDVGDHESHEHRGADFPDRSQKIQQYTQMCQKKIQDHGAAQRKGVGKPSFFQQILVEFHKKTSL